MTAHDTWLNAGSDGPAERDDVVFARAVMAYWIEADTFDLVENLYNAYPSLKFAMRSLNFPAEHRAEIAALVNLSADIRAKVDDEYASRVTNYEDPRDE